MKYIVSALLLSCIVIGCSGEKTSEWQDIPYPPDEDLSYYQAQSDSGLQTYWTDIKAVTSAFLNNSKYWQYKAKTSDIIILGEGIFHGQVEIEMPDFILELTLERKFKEKGRKSIWQVVALKEKPWPVKGSKSDQ